MSAAPTSVWAWTVQAVRVAVELPARLEAILDDVNDLLATTRRTLIDTDRVLGEVREVCAGAGEVSRAAAEVSRSAGSTGRAVDDLLALYDRSARDAAPLLQRLVDGVSLDGVDAAVTLVGQLPQLTERLQSDVLPLLETLGRVAPDLRDLLDLAQKGGQAVDAIPGSGLLRKLGPAPDDAAEDRPGRAD